VKDNAKRWLRRAERAVRPSTQIGQAQVALAAEANERLASLAADLTRLTEQLNGRMAAIEATLAEQRAEVALVREILLNGPPVIDPRNDQYDRWTLEVIRRVVADGDAGIDVGAHSGSILTEIVAASPSGRHFAFEPIPTLAAGLRERFPHVDVHEVALSDAPGSATFHHVTSNPSYSGLLERRYDRPNEQVELTTVEVARLDDIVPDDTPVRFIKIDVEGAELQVLRGGARTLDRHQPVVVFELGLGASDRYGTTPAMVHRFFAEHGYAVSLLDAWLGNGKPLPLDELAEQYESAENYYFIAHPSEGPRLVDQS
jgi:FkbM family methyltransferase